MSLCSGTRWNECTEKLELSQTVGYRSSFFPKYILMSHNITCVPNFIHCMPATNSSQLVLDNAERVPVLYILEPQHVNLLLVSNLVS